MSSSYLLLVGDICDMDTVLQLHLLHNELCDITKAGVNEN